MPDLFHQQCGDFTGYLSHGAAGLCARSLDRPGGRQGYRAAAVQGISKTRGPFWKSL